MTRASNPAAAPDLDDFVVPYGFVRIGAGGQGMTNPDIDPMPDSIRAVAVVNPDPAPRPGPDGIETPDERKAKLRQEWLTSLAKQDEDLVALTTALRLRGYSVAKIATGLNINAARVRRVLAQSRKAGKLSDTLADLTMSALPLAIEKLMESLEKGEPWAIQETLKGTGAFKSYRQRDDTDGERATRTLEVSFVMPTSPTAEMNPKGIVGTPRGNILSAGAIDVTVQAVQVETSATDVPRAAEAGQGESR